MASTNEYPLVTVYLPTKNRVALLERAVESVFAQTYPAIELIVADDGSTDGTPRYLAELAKTGRLRVVTLPDGRGAAAARNAAIAAAQGGFVTGLDDDDYFLPDRISGFVNVWKRLNGSGDERIAGLFSSARLLSTFHGECVLFREARVSAARLRSQNDVGTQIFAPREHFVGAGLFDPGMPCWQDWDMWLRIARRYGDFVSTGETSYVWDLSRHGGHISNKPECVIRDGYRQFAHKAGLRRLGERAGPLAVLSRYPQVNLGVGELGTLMVGGFAGPAVRHVVKRVLGEARRECSRSEPQR